MKKTTTKTTICPKPKQTAAIRTPEPKPEEAIVVGRFAGVLGLRGELKVAGTQLVADALEAGTAVTLTYDAERIDAVIASVRNHGGRLVVTLEGVTDRTAAERFVDFRIAVRRSAIQLAPQEHLDVDLVGSHLFDESGTDLGTVAGVVHYPAQDCLVLAGSGALVPLVGAFVRSVDTAAKRIVVALPPGLLDPAEAVDA